VAAATTAVSPAASPSSTGAAAPTAAPSAPLESAILDTAMAAIRELPEVDQAKVASLRFALESGQIPFDTSKLAALIDRYHRTGQ
jgi:negative regulator of flagellin synthesis FlgM